MFLTEHSKTGILFLESVMLGHIMMSFKAQPSHPLIRFFALNNAPLIVQN